MAEASEKEGGPGVAGVAGEYYWPIGVSGRVEMGYVFAGEGILA
jgi:hypothetical protein